MTEDEMKTKWCPFWRPGETDSEYYPNRPDKLLSKDSAGFCIGSACAMWVETHEWQPGAAGIPEPIVSGGRCGLVR